MLKASEIINLPLDSAPYPMFSQVYRAYWEGLIACVHFGSISWHSLLSLTLRNLCHLVPPSLWCHEDSTRWQVSACFHRHALRYLLVIPYAFNHRLQELWVDAMVNLGIPNWMPNLSTIDNFKRSTILQWFDCTQFLGTLGLVTTHFYTTHLIEHRMHNRLINTV